MGVVMSVMGHLIIMSLVVTVVAVVVVVVMLLLETGRGGHRRTTPQVTTRVREGSSAGERHGGRPHRYSPCA